ncbi:MAG: glycosyltransferase family 2 protein [Lachnospiraceae bacterium]|nr:glycosyltransferase family 2 protein [Lachnospiraceae bacterium]
MRQVDIIVPVYNGLEDLEKCVESVKRHTDLTTHRLILVDDKSPDENILPYLRSLQGKGIHLIESPRNEGFSASVNKGMEYSDRDVILLNSDTIVTRGWVDKMIACAYSTAAAATVTPMSNAATLCSVPEFLKDNQLPEGYSVDDMGDLVETCSIRRYPRITVAVGFCMYIKREVLDMVGLFDAEAFGRGYGEENDFCHRAQRRGYIHLMCDDTFIYHKGTASFQTEEKQKLIQEHERILEERHKEYIIENQKYCSENPNWDLLENIKLYMELEYKTPGVLYMTSRRVRENNGYKEFFAVRHGNEFEVRAYCGEKKILFRFPVQKQGIQLDKARESEEKLFLSLMRAFNLKEVKLMNLSGFSIRTYPYLTIESKKPETECDTRAILRGYLLGKNQYLSAVDEQEGMYTAKITELQQKYDKLLQEDKVRQEELSNIYHSKRYKFASFLANLNPFRIEEE